MNIAKKHLPTCIKACNFTVNLWRIRDGEFKEIWPRSFPISINGSIVFDLMAWEAGKKNELTLPKIFISLEHLFGQSSDSLFDSYKGSFAFPFLLEVLREEQHFYYLFKIADSKGSIFFTLYRVIDNHQYWNMSSYTSQKPIDSELSAEDIEYLICHIWYTMKQTIGQLLQVPQNIQPFYRVIDAVQGIYGFLDGIFFEDCIEDTNQYQSEIKRLGEEYPNIITDPLHKIDETKSWITNIISLH
jgi:hypothetical protein